MAFASVHGCRYFLQTQGADPPDGLMKIHYVLFLNEKNFVARIVLNGFCVSEDHPNSAQSSQPRSNH